jgi:biopolymer transport protein ExbB
MTRSNKGRIIHFGIIIYVVLLVGTTGALPAAAQDEQSAAATDENLDLFTLLWRGGWVMIPIAVASVLALTITIERFISLRRHRIIPPNFLSGIKSLFEGKQADENAGIDYCEKNPCVLANLVKTAMPKVGRGERHLQRTLEDAGAREVDRMRRSIKPLSMIATISPLLGLLGTVYGMIGAFQAASSAGVGKSDVLAEGIYEALVTTAAGLTLAIPVLIIYMILNNRIDAMTDHLDDSAGEFMEVALANGSAGSQEEVRS